MSDSYAQLASYNPALASALMQKQLGQSYLADPSRGGVLGLLAGALLNRGADRDISSAVQSNNDALAQALQQGNSIVGGGSAPQQPARQPQPMPMAPQDQSSLTPIVQQAAAAAGFNPAVGTAMARQESSMGAASPNLFQVTRSTAAQPGYGVAPLPPEQINDPQANARFAMQYAAARARAAGIDPSTPQGALAAAPLFNGGGDPNYAQHVAARLAQQPYQVAQAGNVATDAMPPAMPGQGAPQAPQAPQGAAGSGMPPTGLNSPGVQRALQLQQLAARLAISPDPRMRALAQQYSQQATMIAGLDSYAPGQMNGRPGQFNTRTGQFSPQDLGRPVAAGDTLYAPTGAPLAHITPQPQLIRDPSTGRLVYMQPPGGGAPQGGPGAPQAGAGGSPQAPGGVPMTGSDFGPQAAADANKAIAQEDILNAAKEQRQAQEGRELYGNTYTIRSLASRVPTGMGAAELTQLGSALTAAGVPADRVKELTGIDPSNGELLNKKLFELVSTSVRGMGAREPGSVLFAFQRNYPSIASQPQTIDSMTRLLDMQQRYKEDTANLKRSYVQGSINAMGQGGQYRGLEGFQPPDPKVYAAAALAASGQPTPLWGKGLTPQEQVAAVKLAMSQYPDTIQARQQQGAPAPYQAPQ
jgi:hypothetical protein